MPTSKEPSDGAATNPPAGASPATRSDGVYVVQLHCTETGTPRALVGRLEHVMSGRRHDFDTGAALLSCLRREQAQLLKARRAQR